VLVEILENRRLFAYTPSIVGDGILFLQGTSGDDAGVLVEHANGSITLDGVPQVFLNAQSQAVTVKGIFVEMGDGANGIEVETRTLPTFINGGNNADLEFDAITVVNWGTNVMVNARGGDDLVFVFDRGAVGSIVAAGNGDDTVKVHEGSSSSTSRTWVFGGNGSDWLEGPGDWFVNDNGDIEVISEMQGYVSLFGENGNDTLLCLNETTTGDGGRGVDAAFAIDPSQVTRVEDFNFVIAPA
jgi:hypothetical protein